MPNRSVLQVFLQNVMCCLRLATFKHEKPGGWVIQTLESLFLMMVMYMFYASFSFVYNDNTLHWYKTVWKCI